MTYYGIDETGNVYSRLTVLEKDKERSPGGKIKWICQCDCGNIHSVMGHSLRSGNTKSCGCLNDDKRAERAKYAASFRMLPEGYDIIKETPPPETFFGT